MRSLLNFIGESVILFVIAENVKFYWLQQKTEEFIGYSREHNILLAIAASVRIYWLQQ